MKKSAASLLVIILLFSLLSPSASAEAAEPIVKVKLVNYLGNKSSITIKPTGDYIVQESNTRLLNGKSYTIKYENQDQLTLLDGTSTIITTDQLHVIPLVETNFLSINDRPYLGSFQFVSENSKYVRPINNVYMEDYLKGVVPYEMMDGWKREALKAQAVAARTYALQRISRIIDDSINYQVYAGYKWLPNSTAAVEETRGRVLKVTNYYGKLVLADGLFSASNGGKTESNANVWGSTALSYLPIKDDPFDAQANIKWQFTVQKKQLEPANKTWSQMNEADAAIAGKIKSWMASHGYAGKELKLLGIPVLGFHTPKSGGRISKGDITVEFITKDKVDVNGAYVPQKLVYTDVPASQIRAMVGIDKMWSYLISNITETKDSITVSGLGNGHGVGLSQWGAQKRAEAGQNYSEILGFYYDGASLIQEYNERPIFTAPTLSPVESVTSGEQPGKEQTESLIEDTTPPIISSVSINVDNVKNKANLSFTINEASKLTLYIKDNQNKKDYVLENDPLNAGNVTKEIDLSSYVAGKYYFGIITVDESNNRSSALPSFEIIRTSASTTKTPTPATVKPVPAKDKTAPKISAAKVSVDNVKYKGSLTFKTNEAAYLTITLKDSRGKTIKTLKNYSYTKAGNIKQDFDLASLANGKYTVAISATDKSKNRSSSSSSFTVIKKAKTKTGKVTATRLNMRASASTRAKVVFTLKKYQNVTILSTSGSWYKVKYSTKTGYVSKAYIK
ncbi:SpoIID/LytB domain-containing protein [Neobacillus kokaensis]|uniref:SH3b domain-containing protein n=1 Tax=Neobacillus kokaensis TaxID=2759023 RepID=A0ABQ3N255_9BACI|nr:SpoIID/LytB domain-containing protein [Neobacillus kokaensis]GHH99014.1 hypothetical protein AM1BK_25570 [Neobacillus kokaensis]